MHFITILTRSVSGGHVSNHSLLFFMFAVSVLFLILFLYVPISLFVILKDIVLLDCYFLIDYIERIAYFHLKKEKESRINKNIIHSL